MCVTVCGDWTVTASTSTSVYAQKTGNAESTQIWCEKQRDELKNRLADVMILFFIRPFTGTDPIAPTSNMRDKANMLVAEIEQKILDCSDYLTGTEIQAMAAMRDAAAFVACAADTILNAFSNPEAYADLKTSIIGCLAFPTG